MDMIVAMVLLQLMLVLVLLLLAVLVLRASSFTLRIPRLPVDSPEGPYLMLIGSLFGIGTVLVGITLMISLLDLWNALQGQHSIFVEPRTEN